MLWAGTISCIISSGSTVVPRTEPAFLIRLLSLFASDAAAPPGDERNLVNLEGSKLPQEVQSALTLLVGGFTFQSPVQSVVQVDAEVFILLISFVLFTFKIRWLFLHHDTKRVTRSLYSVSCPSLIHPMTAGSLEYFCRWQVSDLYSKSEAYRGKRNGESTVHTILHSHKLWSVVHLCLQEFFLQSKSGWIVSNALEKSKSMILTVLPALTLGFVEASAWWHLQLQLHSDKQTAGAPDMFLFAYSGGPKWVSPGPSWCGLSGEQVYSHWWLMAQRNPAGLLQLPVTTSSQISLSHVTSEQGYIFSARSINIFRAEKNKVVIRFSQRRSWTGDIWILDTCLKQIQCLVLSGRAADKLVKHWRVRHD